MDKEKTLGEEIIESLEEAVAHKEGKVKLKSTVVMDHISINKQFREACIKFFDAHKFTDKMTVEIRKEGIKVFMNVNGMDVDERGLLDAHEGLPAMHTGCPKCKKVKGNLEPGQTCDACLREQIKRDGR